MCALRIYSGPPLPCMLHWQFLLTPAGCCQSCTFSCRFYHGHKTSLLTTTVSDVTTWRLRFLVSVSFVKYLACLFSVPHILFSFLSLWRLPPWLVSPVSFLTPLPNVFKPGCFPLSVCFVHMSWCWSLNPTFFPLCICSCVWTLNFASTLWESVAVFPVWHCLALACLRYLFFNSAEPALLEPSAF